MFTVSKVHPDKLKLIVIKLSKIKNFNPAGNIMRHWYDYRFACTEADTEAWGVKGSGEGHIAKEVRPRI